jgi:hypothetical protein
MKKTLLAALFSGVAATANAQIPNGDFETVYAIPQVNPVGWHDFNTYDPDSIVTCVKVAGSSGNAIHVETVMHNSQYYLGGFYNTVPFAGNSKPTYLNGMFRYHVLPADSVSIWVVFLKNGVELSRDSFYMTGNQSSFTPFSFPLSNMSAAPDSMAFAAYSIGKKNNAVTGAGSYLELDDIYLGNGLLVFTIPNGDFDNWTTTALNLPAGWDRTNGGISLTTDKHSGNYAVKLVAQQFSWSRILTPVTTTIPVGPKIDTVTGYYKYIAAGGSSVFNIDAGFVQVDVYDKNDLVVAEYIDTMKPVSSYTYFSIPLTNSTNATHMTMRIFTGAEGSEFFVDDVVLKHIDTTDTGTVVRSIPIVFPVTIYPNPVTDVLHISTDQPAMNTDIVIIDAMGAIVREQKGVRHMPADVPVSDLAPGTYFCEIKQGTIVTKEKFVKE